MTVNRADDEREEPAMATTVTIDGQSYRRREPLGVLGLSFITLGIYFLYWYYKVNDEVRRFDHDDSISPTRSLMALLFGWIIIVPPFIAMYNTAKHVRTIEERIGLSSQLEPALVIVIMIVVNIGNGLYVQEHLNRIWDGSAGAGPTGATGRSPLPAAPS
jgi:hypothetical protein